jgi:hypothetical protein
VSEKQQPVRPPRPGERTAGEGAAGEFERLYRANVEAVMAYFARRDAAGPGPDAAILARFLARRETLGMKCAVSAAARFLARYSAP